MNEKKQECLKYIEVYKFYKKGKESRLQGEYIKSLENFNKAIEIAKDIRSKEHEIKCLRQLSITYLELNNLKKFFSLNQEGLKIARKINQKIEAGRCLNNMGVYFWKLDNYSMALKQYEEAFRIAKDIENLEEISTCLTNIGIIYIEMGQYDKALEYLTKALKIDQHLRNDVFISMDLNNIGEIYRNKGLISKKQTDFYKALEYFFDCVELGRKINDEKMEIQALNNIGMVYTALESYSKAFKYFNLALKKAEAIRDIEATAMILNNVGIVSYNQGNYETSIKCYKKAIDLSLEIRAKQILWEAYFGLGQCYERKKEFSLALTYYRKTVDIIDHIRNYIFLDTNKASFTRDKLKVNEALLNLLYNLYKNNPDNKLDREIFYQVEKAKARAFLESLEEIKVNIRERLTPKLKKRETEVSKKISFLRSKLLNPNIPKKKKIYFLNKLEENEDEYLRLISKIKGEIPQFLKLAPPSPLPLEKIQSQHLDEKTALIEYYLGEKRSYLFIIYKKAFNLLALPPRKEIEASVKAYLKILSSQNKRNFRGIQASNRLFKDLLFPLNYNKSNHIENLVIIPDGTLYYLPFESLMQNDEFIINKYKISYAPSSSALIALLEKRDKNKKLKNLLAFGNPIYSSQSNLKNSKFKTDLEIWREFYLSQGFDFSPLPYSKKEILEISNFFHNKKIDIYLDKNAKEEVVKDVTLKDYQIIHFACHGFLDENFPYRSSLVLTLDDDPNEDGFLQVREIYTLRLNADLVVLSACQTGKGKLEKGEGILGLPRIFFYTGAKSVITTLWKINDKSTSKFMSYFYRYISQGKNKAQALRLAKIKMIRSPFAHPFHWAAFVLNGDYNSKLNIR